jgi:hypothetical protein
MTDSQFFDLRRRAGYRILMALTAGLRIVQRSKAIARLLDFLEFHAVAYMRCVIDQAVGLVVEARRRFWELCRAGNQGESANDRHD